MKLQLRTFLLTVVGLILVPLLGVACIAIWWAHRDERRNMEQALLYHARSFIAEDQRGLRVVKLAGEDRMIERRDAGGRDSHQYFAVRDRWLRKINQSQPFKTSESFCSHCAHISSPFSPVARLAARTNYGLLL